MENTMNEQWRWLQEVPEGVRIVAKGGTWIRPKWTKNDMLIRHADRVFVNVHTGDLAHLSRLADLDNPPRKECCPSPFCGNPCR